MEMQHNVIHLIFQKLFWMVTSFLQWECVVVIWTAISIHWVLQKNQWKSDQVRLLHSSVLYTNGHIWRHMGTWSKIKYCRWMDDVSGLLLLHIGLAPYCLLLLLFPYTAGCFRNHCSGSCSSILPYPYHPFLSHQPSACFPLLYPQIFSVIFFLPSCLVTPYLTCISAPLHMSKPSWPSISTFVWDFPLKCTFLVLSILVTPSKNLNIFSSTSISLLMPNHTSNQILPLLCKSFPPASYSCCR